MVKMLAVEGMSVVESAYGWTPLRYNVMDCRDWWFGVESVRG